jgi:serine/threonine protein kinase
MPRPATVAEFVELVRKSGVVEEKRLDAAMDKLRTGQEVPTEPGKLAGLLVRDGLLTLFQANQILDGKWRRFTIGKYKVLEQLGSGGMGSVYLCEHMLMRRRVAVKVLPTAKAEDPASLERFYREARAVAALDHPNIVRAYDIDQSEKLHFLVMEYVDGSSFQEIVKRSGPLDMVRAAHYIRQAALGLQHAHEAAGLVHRDIKPGNILVDRNGIVKVLDMGLARFFHDEEDILTKKYDENVLGTADYLAPEQALDSHNVDIRADIYSLGATFYFCLTGRTPFAEGTVAQKLIWHQTRQPKPLKTIRADVDEGIVAVIEKMMAKDPAQRYQSPLEVAEALSPWTRASIPPPLETEMPRLSLAAMSSGAPSTSDSSGMPALRTSTPGTTPSPRPAWQAATPPSPAPSPGGTTLRTATPPVKPNAPTSAPPPAPARPTPPTKTVPAPGAAAPQPAAQVAVQSPPAAPRPAPAAPQEPAPEVPPWELPAPDTVDRRGQLDTAPSSERTRQRLAQSKEAERTRRRLYWIMGGAGLAGLALIGFLIVKALSSDDSQKSRPEDKPRGPTTYFVGPEEENLTINAALNRVVPGDRIVVRTDLPLREEIYLDQHKKHVRDIRIEADPARPVVWLPPPAAPPKPGEKPQPPKPLLQLLDVHGLTLKGFILDGENRLPSLINLSCGCRNVTLDGLELRNYTEMGIGFYNCLATANQPVTLTRLKANSALPPITFKIRDYFKSGFSANSHIIVKDDCDFTGTFTIPVEGDNANLSFPDKLKPKVTYKK